MVQGVEEGDHHCENGIGGLVGKVKEELVELGCRVGEYKDTCTSWQMSRQLW